VYAGISPSRIRIPFKMIPDTNGIGVAVHVVVAVVVEM